jgi:RNA polymerase sigma-70 factor (ECF subfamily)
MPENDAKEKDQEETPPTEAAKDEETKKKTFWETVPGILTGIAGVFTAIGGLITVLVTIGVFSPPPEPTPTPTAVPPTELRVISTVPELGATDVDPTVTEVVIVFSQPIRQSYSFVEHVDLGEFPEMTSDPVFPDIKTCTLPVKLEPGKTYAIGINSPDHKNFVSLADETLSAEPYTLVFSTAPTQ